jgi:hypothetical protein
MAVKLTGFTEPTVQVLVRKDLLLIHILSQTNPVYSCKILSTYTQISKVSPFLIQNVYVPIASHVRAM